MLETKDDALNEPEKELDHLYHWREPEEIETIQNAVASLGFTPVLIGPPVELINNLDKLKREIDFILNLSVGFTSRFRLALGPALYELASIPYSGADPYTRLTSQNKHLMKSFLDKMGIPTPDWAYAISPDDLQNLSLPQYPVIVKPAYEGSSIGIHENSVANNERELKDNIALINSKLNMPVVVEKFITGREYKVGYIGEGQKKFKGMMEDVTMDGSPVKRSFLYFDVKKEGAFKKIKREINSPEYTQMIRDCDRIFELFSPLDYVTFDLRADMDGNHYFLEFNADATLHPHRTLAQCSKLNDLSYEEMIAMILQSAFERQGIDWQ